MQIHNNKLSSLHYMGLEYISDQGSHRIGALDSEEKIAAAMTFGELARNGYLQSEKQAGGPIYSLSALGRTVLDAWIAGGRAA